MALPVEPGARASASAAPAQAGAFPGRILEPAWMSSLRSSARGRFDAMPWPTTSDEEWRRTDVSRLELGSYAPAPAAKGACPREADTGAWAGVIRFEGTRCTEVGISPAAAARGVRLVPLDLALDEFETPLHRSIAEAIERADNRFIAWHFAALSHGVFLWVPAGVEVGEPFLIELSEQGSRTTSAPHVEVILGEGARASVVHRVAGKAGAGDILSNAGVSLGLGDASSLAWYALQELEHASLYFSNTSARVGRDASLTHFEAQFGARLAKTRVESELAGTGANASLNGVYYGRKGQHMDLRTVQNHTSPKATSRAYYKGAVASGGRTVFQGLIEVAPGAAGTDAFLTNRNLILGEAARSDSIPTLRIGNNDVKCSHGSTTGRLNADQLFYLESRGLSPVDAKEMLVIGYFEDLLTPAPESFREDALTVIRERLRGAA
jgi:Fe-S cluster assembly protein SufD